MPVGDCKKGGICKEEIGTAAHPAISEHFSKIEIIVARWLTSISSALKKLKQDDHNAEASLRCRVKSCPKDKSKRFK